MYIVSWYSYKGGVGRSMSLVNVAIELAQSRQRVLIVDFDLEAPGIETFNLPRPPGTTPGIVEYVTHFIEARESPAVENYIYESTQFEDDDGLRTSSKSGGIWIMPAGIQDDTYGKRLNGIDWQRLYAEQDGFLLFEDLKAQWRARGFDYVFIDSRTGHTDVGNICTRQLPDSVCILFFPNEQNLLGLRRIVANIRHDKNHRGKDITLHFVTSNVPELDDEDQILENRFRRFRESLGYERLSATIHHYNSLALLNQVIFTEKRRNSRLAAEYRRLCHIIRQHNAEDREGALEFLRKLAPPVRGKIPEISAVTVEDRLAQIAAIHTDDPEVLYQLANVRRRQGQHGQALSLIDDAIEHGFANAEALLNRAELRMFVGVAQDAKDDLEAVLRREDVNYFELSRAAQWLLQISPASLQELPGSKAIQSLDADGKLGISSLLLRDSNSLRVAKAILQSLVLDERASPTQRTQALNTQALCLIGLHEFEAAITTIRKNKEYGELVHCVFNYAMAKWGLTHELDRELMKRVVSLAGSQSPKITANFRQCLAIAYWAINDNDEARNQIRQARQICMIRDAGDFSAWRYCLVSPEAFLSDLDELESLVDGSNTLPHFLATGLVHNGEAH